MKITKSILKQIIKEEILKEVYSPPLTPVKLKFSKENLDALEKAFKERDGEVTEGTKAFMDMLRYSREFAALNPELNNKFLEKLINSITNDPPKPDQEPVASAEEKEV